MLATQSADFCQVFHLDASRVDWCRDWRRDWLVHTFPSTEGQAVTATNVRRINVLRSNWFCPCVACTVGFKRSCWSVFAVLIVQDSYGGTFSKYAPRAMFCRKPAAELSVNLVRCARLRQDIYGHIQGFSVLMLTYYYRKQEGSNEIWQLQLTRK